MHKILPYPLLCFGKMHWSPEAMTEPHSILESYRIRSMISRKRSEASFPEKNTEVHIDNCTSKTSVRPPPGPPRYCTCDTRDGISGLAMWPMMGLDVEIHGQSTTVWNMAPHKLQNGCSWNPVSVVKPPVITFAEAKFIPDHSRGWATPSQIP